jgi:hypothetical protein
MRKILLLLAVSLSSSLFAQSPPQIPLTGNIGVQGSVAILGGTTVQMPSDANYTLTPSQWSNKTLIVTSASSLTATRNIVGPLNKGQEFNIENSTTGGQSIVVIGASGIGVTIANGASAAVFSDGVNYIQSSTGGGGSGTVTHSTGALTANHVVIGNGTGDVKADTGVSTDGAGNLAVASISTTSSAQSGSAIFGYAGTPAAAPSTNQFQISPAIPITTPWSLSPAAAPSSGFLKGVNTAGVVQQSFEAQVNLASEVTGILPPTKLALIPGIAGPNYFYGDSLTSPSAIADSGPYRQMAMRLGNDLLGTKSSTAFSGQELGQITAQVLSEFPVWYNTTSNSPKVWFEGGANNALLETVTTGSINNFSLEYAAAIAWIETPLADKVYASSAVAGGTWTTAGLLILDPSNTGHALQTATNGNTLTFSIPADGTFSGITYYAPASANGGTFTYSIDGVLQTDICSGTTTFANTGCNGVAVINAQGAFYQQFPVAAGTHTGVVKVTSATAAGNVVYILDAGVSPATKTGLPIMITSGVLRQRADAMSASTLAFDSAQAAVVTAYQPWANIIRVDVRGGTLPGVNTTTDFDATSVCPGGSSPVHPNSCGFQHWVQTVESAATAAGLNIFYPGIGVVQSTSLSGFQALGPITSGDIATGTVGQFQIKSLSAATSINGASPNIFNQAVPSATTFSQLNCDYPTLGGSVACSGLMWDAITGRYSNAMVSTYENSFIFCPNAGSTTGPAGCTVEFHTDPITHAFTTTFPLNAEIITGNKAITITPSTAAGVGATATCFTANGSQCTASSGFIHLVTGTGSTIGDLVDIQLVSGALPGFSFNCVASPGGGTAPVAASLIGLGVNDSTSSRFGLEANIAPADSTDYYITYFCGN